MSFVLSLYNLMWEGAVYFQKMNIQDIKAIKKREAILRFFNKSGTKKRDCKG